MSSQYIPFRPSLHGHFARRFYEQIKSLDAQKRGIEEIDRVVRIETEWAVRGSRVNPAQRRIYRAAWLLLRDLVRVGWKFRWHCSTLEVAPPSMASSKQIDVLTEKDKIRKFMSFPRLDRIADGRDFVHRMEQRSFGQAKVPVSDLIANGVELAADLASISLAAEGAHKSQALQTIIQPYLQLVREGERCSETGHKLSDIWRYFRYSWASPADSTPGRTMLYLVRDRARRFHPIMGIASLENASLAITARDTHLGWTVKSFQIHVARGLDRGASDLPIRSAFEKLLSFIDPAISDIDLTGLCSAKECEQPTERLLLRLAGVVSRSKGEQQKALRDWHSRNDGNENDVEPERSDMGDSSTEAVDALYRRKRADQLGRLLAARLYITKRLADDNLLAFWAEYVNDIGKKTSSSGLLETAIRTALQAVKNRHVGTSMLELNVCGAIPPYNELLGGKLVALLMLSPQVVSDYRLRYGDRPSDIASKMKGEPVVRPAELLYVGTTSLYRSGASQYNRLKLPAGLLRADAPEVRWKELGETSGFGTLHLSRLTAQCLEEAANEDGETYVHHVFGEGTSPKMRQFRHGLDAVLGSSSDTKSAFTKHQMNRLIYGAWLAVNGPEIFLGASAKPEYYFDEHQSPEDGTRRIAEYWKERWLTPRLGRDEVLANLRKFDPLTLRISSELKSTEQPDEFRPIRLEESPMSILNGDSKSDASRNFVRDLYLGASSYADGMTLSQLELMHVKTGLDEAIVKAVKSGKSVVLTGNPGDGKTHILRVLEKRLSSLKTAPSLELDASTRSNEEIKRDWERARRSRRPYCIAINEAILKSLADDYPNFKPLVEAQEQVENAVVYGADDPKEDSVIVFDLSRRNALAPDIVNAAIDKLTNEKMLSTCAQCPLDEGCDLARNRKLLGTDRFRKRLQLLLDRVTLRGYHATLRELQNLISYLLFAGRTCDRILLESGDYQSALPQLPFGGRGRLFRLLRDHFDPVAISHPIWDEALILANTVGDDWLKEWVVDDDSLSIDDFDRFRARKRAFYFFHRDGAQLLHLAGNDEGEFDAWLNLSERDALRRLIRLLNGLFGMLGRNDELRVWQSHRYNQSPRRILYSSQVRLRSEFEIARPRLRVGMANAYSLARSYVVLRAKQRRSANLRIDFEMFNALRRAELGLPILSLDGDVMRRVWQFMEQLYDATTHKDDVAIVLFDPSSAEQLTVEIDTDSKRYLNITRRGVGDEHSH